jgi:hypothetical protein
MKKNKKYRKRWRSCELPHGLCCRQSWQRWTPNPKSENRTHTHRHTDTDAHTCARDLSISLSRSRSGLLIIMLVPIINISTKDFKFFGHYIKNISYIIYIICIYNICIIYDIYI